MSALLIPIVVLNLLAGLVGGIWLAVAGQWALVGLGLAITIGGAFFASILLIPGMALAIPMMKATDSGNEGGALIAGFAGMLYTYAVMGLWAIVIFIWFVGSSATVVPAVLWSYAAATATWSYLAQKEQQTNEYSPITSAFHQFGCLALIIYCLLNQEALRWQEMAFWYGIPMVICAILSTYLAAQSSRGSSF